jgi:hypothetical protein
MAGLFALALAPGVLISGTNPCMAALFALAFALALALVQWRALYL